MAQNRQATIKITADGAVVVGTYEKIGDAATKAGARIKAANEAANSTTGKFAQGVSNAFGQVNKNLAGFSYQIQDIAVGLGSGQSPLTVLMQQGTQIASLFGPAGAVIGAVGAGLGLLGGLFLRSSEQAEGATEKTREFGGALEWLGRVASTTSGELSELIGKYRQAGDEAREISRLELKKQSRELEEQLAAARGHAGEAISALPVDRWRESMAGEVIPIERDEAAARRLQNIKDLLAAVDQFQAGGSLVALSGQFDQLATRASAAGNTEIRTIADKLLESARNAAELEAQLKRVKDELGAIGSVNAGVPFPFAKPDDVPDDTSSGRTSPGRAGGIDRAALMQARLAGFQTTLQAEIEMERAAIIKRNQFEQRGLQERNDLRLQAEQQSMQQLEQERERQRRIAEFERPLNDPLAGAQEKLAELADSSKQYGRFIGDSIQLAADTGTKALSAFVLGGKAGLKDLAETAAEQLLNGAIGLLVNGLFGGLGQAILGKPGAPALVTPGSTGSSAATYGGPRAGGGDVRSDRWYWVGERGPERFYPDRAGRVEAAGGGGGARVTNTIIDQRGQGAPPVETQTSTGPDGSVQLRTLIRSELASSLARGGSDVGGAMKGAYGARRKGRR